MELHVAMWWHETGSAFLPAIEAAGGEADSSILQNVTHLVGAPQGPQRPGTDPGAAENRDPLRWDPWCTRDPFLLERSEALGLTVELKSRLLSVEALLWIFLENK